VAHRDIKPENILAGPYGEVLLLDWGLAKVWHPDSNASGSGPAVESEKESELAEQSHRSAAPAIEDITLTGHGKAQGTVHYMSPEQLKQDPLIDHRTDIFSLGAVLYEILCGEKPAHGEKLHEVVDSVLNQQPAEAAAVAKYKVPTLLNDIAARCLDKNPDSRFQSMEEVIMLLQQDWMS
jgi:serine/threonine-protein kinase